MNIKLHTVGKIVKGNHHEGWYLFIQTYKKKNNYLVLYSNDPSFGRTEEGDVIEGALGYDVWMPDMTSLEHLFDEDQYVVEWLEEYKVGLPSEIE